MTQEGISPCQCPRKDKINNHYLIKYILFLHLTNYALKFTRMEYHKTKYATPQILENSLGNVFYLLLSQKLVWNSHMKIMLF
jgi:hypothetical protein